MSDIIKNWKFGLTILFSTIIFLIFPIPITNNIETWVGFILIVSSFGFIYEIAKFWDRRNGIKKQKHLNSPFYYMV